jgi:hypothetical protein
MARQKVADEITALLQQRAKLDARLKAAEARQKEKEEQQDQRRKMVAGAVALEYIAANPDTEFARLFSDLLDRHLTRPMDRALFPALSTAKSSHSTATQNSSKAE